MSVATLPTLEMTAGEFFQAIVAAADGQRDPCLVPAAAAPGIREALDSEGGFLAPPTFTKGVLEKAYNTGEILRRCTQLETGGRNKVVCPTIDESNRNSGSRFGGVTIYRVDEAGTMTDSKPAFAGQWRTTHKLAAVVYASTETVQDFP
jgi:HK97 family phage major capsid protein